GPIKQGNVTLPTSLRVAGANDVPKGPGLDPDGDETRHVLLGSDGRDVRDRGLAVRFQGLQVLLEVLAGALVPKLRIRLREMEVEKGHLARPDDGPDEFGERPAFQLLVRRGGDSIG